MKYIFTTLTIAIMISYAYSSFAGKTNDIINRERLRRDQMVKKIIKGDTKKGNSFEKYKQVSKQKMHDYQKLIKEIKDEHVKKVQSRGFVKPLPQVVVFVSFSMPSLSLKQIIRDASQYEIPVVIRGLYKNSFRETMERVFDLVKEDNKGGVSINPLWFRKYRINAVPAVVVNYSDIQNNMENKVGEKKKEKNGNKEVSKKANKKDDFDVVYGNIPLIKALKIVAERGDISRGT